MTTPDPAPQPQADPDQDRATRRDRVLARLVEIQMEVAEATRTEAVETPVAGVDYCGRLAVIARSVRQTLLLEDKFSRPPEDAWPHKAWPPQAWPQKAAAGPAAAADRSRSRLRVTMAMGAAAIDGAEIEQDEADRRFMEMAERLERPELAELVERCPPLVAVARLCRMFGLPEEAARWLEEADAGLAELAAQRQDDVAEDPPRRYRSAGRSRPRAPETG